MFTQLVATKYRSPPLRAGTVPRPSLLTRLHEAICTGYRLILVSAPAGYGKTTLLTAWVAAESALRMQTDATDAAADAAICAWLTIEAADNDPLRFLAYVRAAIEHVCPQSCAMTTALLQQADPALLPVLLPALTNDIGAIPGRVVLILDDYHAISQQGVHDSITFLIQHAPENLQVVVSTRVDPPLPIAQLRGRNQMSELRQQDLRFTLTEAAQLLATALPLPEQATLVDLLNDRTEGWPAGLQMAAISLQGHANPDEFVHAFSGSQRHILDYLAEEVLNRQPDAIQSFLMRTSILDRLCAPLCEALFVDYPDFGAAQPILEQLEQANLFIVALDDQRVWYRYHHLFGDLLRHRLTSAAPNLAPTLHRRAAQWCAGAGLLHDAIEHALRADDHERAADWIAYMAESVMKSSELATLRRWIEALPPATMRKRPLLSVYYGGIRLLMGEAVAPVEASLRNAFAGRQDDSTAGAAVAFQALAATLHGHNRTSDLLAHRALALLPVQSPFFRNCVTLVTGMNQLFAGHDDAATVALHDAIVQGERNGDLLNVVLARCYLAQLAIIQGRMQAAVILYEEAATQSKDEPISGLAHLGLALVHYDWNNLTRAALLLETGLRRVAAWSEMPEVQGMLLLARVQRLLGDLDAAHMLEHRAAAGALLVTHMAPVQRALLLYLMRHAAWQGNRAAVEFYAAKAGLPANDGDAPALPASLGEDASSAGNSFERAFLTLSWARLCLVRGRFAAAAAVAAALAAQSLTHNRLRLAAKAQIVLALAAFAGGETSRAVTELGRALTLAAPERSIRLFVDEGDAMTELLTLCQRRGIFGAYVAQLLAACHGDTPFAAPAPAAPNGTAGESALLIEPLSERETQILRLMADGHSNEEISHRLGIARSTVKTHVHSIFQKLQASRRTQVIARARAHNLL